MPKNFFFFLFTVIWLLPPVINYFKFDSYTLSTAISILFYSIVHLAFRKILSFKKYFFNYFFLFFSIITINIIITTFIFGNQYDISRSLISLVLAIIFFVGAYYFSKDIAVIEKKNFDVFFNRLLYFYIFIVVVSLFTKTIFTQYSKPIFPYTEPSHLALFFGPVWCYNVITSKTTMKRFFLIILGLVIALLVKNMTLMLTVIITALFIYHIYFIPIGIVGGLIIYFFSDIEYFLMRFNFESSKRTNLSSLVYIKGFELMKESLIKSDGIGIGFQQMGIIDIKTKTQLLLIKIMGSDLNAKDGGFLASKLISEFGIIGIILISSYLTLFIRSWFKFRNIILSKISTVDAVFYASIITIFSELFFRGLGYFTPSVFLFLASIFLMKNKKENLIIQKFKTIKKPLL